MRSQDWMNVTVALIAGILNGRVSMPNEATKTTEMQEQVAESLSRYTQVETKPEYKGGKPCFSIRKPYVR